MEKKPPDIYKSIKLALKQVAKDENVIRVIGEAVERTNAIWRRANQMLKCYILEDIDRALLVEENFLDMVMQSVCIQSSQGRKATTNKDIKTELMSFYDKYQKWFLSDLLPDLKYKHLNTVLDYCAVTWITSITNNIQSNYTSYVETYVNFNFDRRQVLEAIKADKTLSKHQKGEKKRSFLKELRMVKNDLLNVSGEPLQSDGAKLDFIRASRTLVLPNKNVYEKDSVLYDICIDPIPYLVPMLRMMNVIERSDKEYKPKLKNVLPSSNSLLPRNIRIDTKTLMNLFQYNPKGTVREVQELVWDEMFRTERKSFQGYKGYRFNNSILTDGISCTLLFIREDKYGKRYSSKSKKAEPYSELYLDEYVDELKETFPGKLEALKEKKVIGIDPNMGNLIYCMNEGEKVFRYTQGQRLMESKKRWYDAYFDEWKKTSISGGKSVEEWETILSQHDSKTVDLERYKGYLKDKLLVEQRLQETYLNAWLRINRLHSYRNRRKSEQKMEQSFKKVLGFPEDCIVCIGDWEQKKHMKYKAPVKGKGFRELIRKMGYQVFLIWEHKTSLQCYHCQKDDCRNEKFFKVKYENKAGVARTRLLHSLLKCKTCRRVWNRCYD